MRRHQCDFIGCANLATGSTLKQVGNSLFNIWSCEAWIPGGTLDKPKTHYTLLHQTFDEELLKQYFRLKKGQQIK
jgi:hypothetical protein